MKDNIVAGTGVIVGFIQLILHILGIIGILGGVIALIAGNSSRGWELIIGGLIFIAIKYLLGFLFLGIGSVFLRNMSPAPKPALAEHADDNAYDKLVITLSQIKHATADRKSKYTISKKLILNAQLYSDEKVDLLDQLEKIYRDEE